MPLKLVLLQFAFYTQHLGRVQLIRYKAVKTAPQVMSTGHELGVFLAFIRLKNLPKSHCAGLSKASDTMDLFDHPNSTNCH